MRKCGDGDRIGGLFKFCMNPAAVRLVGRKPLDLGFDKRFLVGTDMPVGLGCSNHGRQHGAAVHFHLRGLDVGQAQGCRSRRRMARHGAGCGRGLARLPILIRFQCKRAQCRRAAVSGELAAHLAEFFVPKKQAQRAARQCTATESAHGTRNFGTVQCGTGILCETLTRLQYLL